MRNNVAGLSVEYSKRYLDAAGEHLEHIAHQRLSLIRAHQPMLCPSCTSAADPWAELFKRCLPAGVGASQWSVRGLLDFNLAFKRFPDALPSEPGSYPPNPPGAAFTLLREGDAWLDEDHNLLVAVERVAACTDTPKVTWKPPGAALCS